MEVNTVDVCPLVGGDYIVSVNMSIYKDDIIKLKLKTKEDIQNYIRGKLKP